MLSNQNYRAGRSLNVAQQRYYVVRGDYKFTDSDSVMARYTLQDFVTDDFRHNLKFGLNLTRSRFEHYQADTNLFGNLTFSKRCPGFPYADFLLGRPSTVRRSFASLRQNRLRYPYDYFFTDNFKVNQRLTLNYGLRYEYHPGWNETHGSVSTFDLASGSIVVPDGSLRKASSAFPQNYVKVVMVEDYACEDFSVSARRCVCVR